MPYVYSTLSADQAYCLYPTEVDPKGLIEPMETIFIAGKANVMDPKTFLTPKGMCTSIGEEELAVLEQVPAFKRHQEAGYILVERKKGEVDKVVKNMTAKDAGAQLTDDDFEAEKKPKVN